MLNLGSIFQRVPPSFFRVATMNDLLKINSFLGSIGLPVYFEGLNKGMRMFNPVYRLQPTPRFVLTFRGFRLDTVYLRTNVQRGTSEYRDFANYFYPGVDYGKTPDIIDRELAIKVN